MQPYPTFAPGDDAILKGSFEVVSVVIQFQDTVLIKRAGGQMAVDADKLEPWCGGQCPIKPGAPT